MFSWKGSSTPAKFVIIFTVGILVSLGMCGLTMFGNVGDMSLAVIGLLVFVVSVVGLIVTPLVALIHGTVSGRGSGGPQKLFDDHEEKK
jgi:hypothetical protein